MRRGAVLIVMLVLMAGLAPAPAAADESVDGGVRVTRTEARKLVLTWDVEPGATSYQVLQDGVVVEISDDNWFVATDLEPLTEYVFGVRPNSDGPSAVVTASTGALTPPPTTIDVWWIGPKGVTLAFGFGEFEVRRDGVVVAERSGRVFTDTGLTPGTDYVYEVRAIGAIGNLGPAATQVIDTRPLLDQVLGVTASAVEPGVVELSWTALDDPTVRYRVFVDGALATRPTPSGATSARVEVPLETSSVVQVGGYNGGGGPLSEPITITSGPADPRQINLKVRASWPGTLILQWDSRAATEDVLFNGNVVAEGTAGWATVRNVPFGAAYDVSVRSDIEGVSSESVTSPVRASAPLVRDVRSFAVRALGSDAVNVNFRKDPFVSFELYRNGEFLTTIEQVDIVPYIDEDVTPGETYVYSIRQVADGARGESQPVMATVTVPAW